MTVTSLMVCPIFLGGDLFHGRRAPILQDTASREGPERVAVRSEADTLHPDLFSQSVLDLKRDGADFLHHPQIPQLDCAIHAATRQRLTVRRKCEPIDFV